MSKMKKGKSMGLDNIPIEAWYSLGDTGINFITAWINNILNGKEMPNEWGKSILVTIFRNKGDVQNCSNYRGIKLMSHTMKL